MRELVSLCEEASAHLEKDPLKSPVLKRLKRDARLRALARDIESRLHAAGEIYAPRIPPNEEAGREIKAVTWNIERGKRFDSILRTIQTAGDLYQPAASVPGIRETALSGQPFGVPSAPH